MPQGTRLGSLYRDLYDVLCGTHPKRWPWHSKWLSTGPLYRSLRSILPTLGGAVLDAGCGEKPYRPWFGDVTKYIGLDVAPGESVDVVVPPGAPWPLPDGHFDAVLCTQALMYVPDLNLMCAEIERVLKPGGTAVVSFAFMFQEHSPPFDLRRISAFGAGRLFPGLETLRVERLGGVGSTLGIFILNWIDMSLNRTYLGKAALALLLPVWIVFSLLVNIAGRLLDLVDRTGAFYANVLVVARKPRR
jgi:SAM-dependent methyltransferase